MVYVKILLTPEQLHEGVSRLAAEVTSDYQQRPLTVIGVLTGSLVLVADLIRLLEMPLRVGVVQASSYRGATTRPGELLINSELMPDIQGRDVLLVDDIFDTGKTLEGLMARLSKMGATSVRSAVLLRKEGRQEVSLEPDYVGFAIPDEFVVGYGLDYQDAFRNLPHVAFLEPHEISATPP
jgi:hypoxanthine phosphoribosyltransferase